MEVLGTILEVFRTTLITIPFFQLFMLIVVSTILLLLGSLKLALLANYVFTFYWGFSVNFGNSSVFDVGTLPWFSFTYLGFGLMVVLLVLVSFRHSN